MRRLRILLLVLAGLLGLSGCDFSVYDMPLPGGADVGDHPMVVRARFDDVLDLVPQSTVKIADVTVGKVTDITLDGYTAVVTMQLRRDDVHLPDDARADIRQTSLLGEKFVSLSAPPDGGSGALSDDDLITATGRNPEVEDVLGALSLVLNGGGVAQLKTIAGELNKALEGHEGSARSLLTQVRVLTTQLDENRGDLVDAIDALDRLSTAANRQRGAIDAALDDLPAALRSLDSQRADLVKMLTALDRLSSVGVRVIRSSKADTIRSLENLTPILSRLAEAGDALPKSLNVFLTYPFVDEVVGRNPTVARNLHMGDYTNLSIKLDLNLDDLSGLPSGLPSVLPTGLPTNLPSEIDPTAIVGDLAACLGSADLTSAACRRLLGTPAGILALKKACAKPKNQDKDVCTQLNALPDLPLGSGGVTLPALPTLIPGLPRPGVGPSTGTAPTDPRGPTMRQLMERYDPDLVSLLVPGLVGR